MALSAPTGFGLRVLRDAAEAAGIAPARTLFGTAVLLLEYLETAKQNREQISRLRSFAYSTVLAVYEDLEKIEDEDNLPQDMLVSLEQLCTTLNQVREGVEKLQQRGKLASFVLKDPTSAAIKQFMRDLRHAFAVFQLSGNLVVLKRGQEYHSRQAETVQLLVEELNEQMNELKATSRDGLPALVPNHVLPPRPHILFGRDLEIETIVSQLLGATKPAARIALLGPGGVGKTTVARRVLHDERVRSVYHDNRFYVACDSVTSAPSLLALIVQQLGLTSDQPAEVAIIRFLQDKVALLVLDNFETPWEPTENRVTVQDQLASLAALEGLAILITLRGAERPLGTSWSKPLLPQLAPLQREDAMQTFLELSGLSPEREEQDTISKLLELVGNLPLAIALLAGMAHYESLSGLMQRWEVEETAVVAESSGSVDRLTSLDVSIRLSLTCARMRASKDALAFLAFLSLLPDGLATSSRTMSILEKHIPSARKSITVLRQVALATENQALGRLSVLSPIRLYMLKHHTPPDAALDFIKEYYVPLSDISHDMAYHGTRYVADLIGSETGNLASCLGWAMQWEESHNGRAMTWAARATLDIAPWARASGRFGIPPALILQCYDLGVRSGDTDLQMQALTALVMRTPDRPLRIQRQNLLMGLARKSENSATVARAFMTVGIVLTPGPDGHDLIVEALQRFQSLPDVDKYVVDVSRCHFGMARGLFFRSNYVDCVAHALKSEEVIGPGASLNELHRARSYRAWALLRLGRVSETEKICLDALATVPPEDIPLLRSYPDFKEVLSAVYLSQCKIGDSMSAQLDSAEWYKENRREDSYGWAIMGAAETALEAGDLTQAAALQAEAMVILTRTGNVDGMALGRAVSASIALQRGDADEAEALARIVQDVGWQHRRLERVEQAAILLSKIKLASKNTEPAMHHAITAAVSATKTKGSGHLMEALRALALGSIALDDHQTALSLAQIVMVDATHKQLYADIATSLVLYGDIYGSAGNKAFAEKQYRRAIEIYQRGKASYLVEGCLAKIEALDEQK